MKRLLLSALVFLGALGSAHAAAVLVTMTSGGVQLKDGSGKKPVPSGGFALLEGQSLIIPTGGLAVVLTQGSAAQMVGPMTFATGDQVGASGAGTSQAALSSVLGRKSSTSSVGATRGGGGFTLLRPVEGTSLARLGGIRWTCSDCESQDIEVIDQQTFEPIWSATGELQLTYDGDPLAPGEYALKVDETYLAFTVVDPQEASHVASAAAQARSLASTLSLANQVAIEAGVWSHAGMPTEALYTVDRAISKHPGDPALEALLQSYQKMVRPE